MYSVSIKKYVLHSSYICIINHGNFSDFSIYWTLIMTAISAKSGSDGEKSKFKQTAAPTRVVIRKLPPSMTKEDFKEQISPIPEHDNLRFAF